MKKLSTLLFFICLSVGVFAQTPKGFNYQSVLRDASGEVVSNTVIGVQFKLRKTTATGAVTYTETHTPTTNAYGVFALVVGQGTSSADFSSIDWAADTYFLEVGVDMSGGTSYTNMGTSQLWSVPYALQAKYVENGDDLGSHTATKNIQTAGYWVSNDGDDEGLFINAEGRVTTSEKLVLGSNVNLGTNWINADGTNGKGIKFDSTGNVITSGNVGIGETTPQASLDVVDIAVIGNTTVGTQSTSQNASSQKDLGFVTSPWMYTKAIEATDERGSSSTLITLGNDGNFGSSDEIHFVTDGASQLDVSKDLVNVTERLAVGGNIDVGGILNPTSGNVIFGDYSNTGNLSNLSDKNVIIGSQAAEAAQSGGNNVVIGYFAGYNLNGSSNVIIGAGAGTSGAAFSNKLYIRDLLYGEFDNDLLQVKGALEVDDDIQTDGEITIDQDGDDLMAAGAKKAVEIISVIINPSGTINSNVTNSSGITSSLSGNTYTVSYSGHFSSPPAVNITCIAASTSNIRIPTITLLGSGKVEFRVASSGGTSKTDAGAVLHIIGRR